MPGPARTRATSSSCSHQLPIWVTHLAVAGLPTRHDPRRRRCALSSVTSFETRRRRVARDRLRRAGVDRRRRRRGGGVMRGIRSLAVSARRPPLVAGCCVFALAACANDPLAEQYRAGDNKGYIAGDFRVVEIPADRARRAGRVRGHDRDRRRRRERGLRRRRAGRELLVRRVRAVPRRGRRPRGGARRVRRARTSRSSASTRSTPPRPPPRSPRPTASPTRARSRPRRRAIKLAFAEKTPIQATPTTLVLDAEGRVAARIIGQLPDASILTTLVRDTLAEES